MVLCCQPAPGGAECSCIAWFPPPPPPRPTYLQSTLMEMVNCGTVTLQSAAELTQGQCTHMHMFNYTICTHCEKCSEECEIDGLCRRFQLCREAVLPPVDREKQVPRCSSVIMDTATPTFTTFTLDPALVAPGSSNQVLVLDINWTMIVVQVSSCL